MSLPGEFVDPNPPSTLAEALSRSDVSPRFCLQVTYGMELASWFYIGGKVGDVGYFHPLGDQSGVFNDSVDEVIGVTVNGTALTQGSSVDDVCHNNGKWFWDGVTTQSLIISMPDGSNPQARGVTVMATGILRVSKGPCDAGGFRWRPWLTSVPGLTRQVNADFSGINVLGGGKMTFQNENQWFDTRLGYFWDFGRVTILMGASGLPFNQFVTLATFVANAPLLNDDTFELSLQDPKVLLDTKFPKVLYDSLTYPNLETTAIGKPVQLAYGHILGAAPVCIDIVNAVFKVAGHAITGFNGVRILNNTTGLWDTKNFASTNAASGEFTLNPADWSMGQSVVVDFDGMPDGNGFLMANPADILSDLLTRLGQPVNSPAFVTARARYDVGYVGINPLNRRVVHAPSLYLDSQQKAITTINTLLVNVRAYLQTLPDGSLAMTPFRCKPVASLPVLTDNNILAPGLVVDGTGTSNQFITAGSKISSVQVTFNHRDKEGISSVVTATYNSNRYKRGATDDVVQTTDSLFTNADDAKYLAQSLVNEFRVDPLVFSCALKWLPFTWQPGQQVRAFFPRHCLDVVLEVLSIALDLTNSECRLTLGNLRGFMGSSGFWCQSSDLTPLGNGLSWPNTGQANDQTGEIGYIRYQAGHWHGPDDFAVDTSLPLPKYSDLDKAVSRWQ